MKVQLIVVQGKPEGKIIPLAGPIFKIGRGETCHLRPNSEQVSREHSEFSITADQVVVRDLGSRNGTIVNGKPLTAPYTLKDRDLIQVGPLTFAISMQGIPAPAAKLPPAEAPAKSASPDDISNADIEAWLVSDNSSPTPDRPSGVYGGDTQTISAYQGTTSAKPGTPAPGSVPDETDDEEETTPEDEPEETDEMEAASDTEATDEFIDESNPFYRPPKKPEAPVKPSARDSSSAADDILRKLMEHRRHSR
jgi:hypothetical protein